MGRTPTTERARARFAHPLRPDSVRNSRFALSSQVGDERIRHGPAHVSVFDPIQTYQDPPVISLLVKQRLDNEFAGLKSPRRQLSEHRIVRIIV